MLNWFKRLAVAGLCSLAVNAFAAPLPFTSLENVSPTGGGQGSCDEGIAPVVIMDFDKDGAKWRYLYYAVTDHFILVDFTHGLVWKGRVVNEKFVAGESITLDEAKQTSPCVFLTSPDA